MAEISRGIQMKNLANLKKIAESIPDGDGDTRPVGVVIGKARGISYRSAQDDGPPSIAINGIFEARPSEAGRANIRATMVFFPRNYAAMLEVALRGDQLAPKKAPPRGMPVDLEGVGEIRVAVQIGIRKSSGAIGYEFVVVDMLEETNAVDALADLRGMLTGGPALEAPKAAKAIAGPKSKGKKK